LQYLSSMKITATSLRKNLYTILDRVAATGTPVEVERKGKIIKIIVAEKKSKLDNLEPHSIVKGDPEELVTIDWTGEWRGL
jgi:hypothetical protein